jgi:hypothetical protein
MRKRPGSDWLQLIVSMAGYALAVLALALLMNFPGDCFSDAEDCGQDRRRASFLVLGLGAVWLLYLLLRFLRDSDRP